MLKDKHNPISPESLVKFNEFIGHHMGLNFKQGRLSELEGGIQGVSREFGYDDPEACIQWLITSPLLTKKQIEILTIYLTVGETFFFRENETFTMLDSHILPQFIRSAAGKPRPLRIWSMACSTGEEAYSVAIILDQKKQQLKGWDITILATDINIKALEKAQTGVYSQWSLRSTPEWIKNRYFILKEKKSYEIKSHIKQMVTFDYLNLVEDVYPSLLNNTNAMDIIFCRNVLMYFLPGKAESVVRKLYHSLVPGGWLLVSPTDSFHFLEIECFQLFPSNAYAFTKCDKKKKSVDMDLPVFYQAPLPDTPGISPPVTIPEPVPVISAGEGLQPAAERKTGINDSFAGIYARALQLYSQGNYPEVIDALQELPDINRQTPKTGFPGPGEIYSLVARSYANLGQLDHAEKWCQKAIETDKLNPGYRYLLVTIFQEQGNEIAAVQSLKKCLYIDPNFILAHFTLGNLLGRQKDDKMSHKHLNLALSLLKSHGDEDIVSREEGLTAGRLREIIKHTLEMRKGHGNDR